MPECAACDRYLAPNAVKGDGSCPGCGEPVTSVTETREAPKIPWHFWLVLTLAAVYLLWRGVETVAWLIDLIS